MATKPILWVECFPTPSSHVEAPIPHCDGMWSLWEVIKVKLGHEDGALLVGSVALYEEDSKELRKGHKSIVSKSPITAQKRTLTRN